MLLLSMRTDSGVLLYPRCDVLVLYGLKRHLNRAMCAERGEVGQRAGLFT